MRGRSLAVLMWKHLRVKRRRFIHVTVELISPILIVLITVCIRKGLSDQSKSENSGSLKIMEPKLLSEQTTYDFLLYTPENKLTHNLMNEVGRRLNLKRQENLLDERKHSVFAFSNNISEISEFVKKIHSNKAVVIFKNINGDKLPSKLEYTIRSNRDFQTNTYHSDLMSNNYYLGVAYHHFMRVQWAIDMSYISARASTHVTEPEKIYIEEFPYHDSESNVRKMRVMQINCAMMQRFCWGSLLIVFVFLMSRLLEERTTGIQELIQMVGVSSNTLGLSHFLNMVPAGLVYVVGNVVIMKVGPDQLVPHSDPLIICMVLALHYLSVIAMAMAFSYIVKTATYTGTMAVFAYMFMLVPVELVTSYTPHSKPLLRLTGLLPHVPMYWMWNEIAEFEMYGNGLSFSDMARSHTPVTGSVLSGCALLVVQCAICFFLSWYLSHVRPGKYGQPKPWNFLFSKQYWTRSDIQESFELEEEVPIVKDKKYFEDTPQDHEVGIRIDNVSKIFPKHKALSNVSLEVYKGEITILLGHNGAGKTTLMSIITGMMSATEGKVYVNGMDSVAQRDEVRSQLGLCPQHNLFFSDLTVLEHVQFFTLLKGGSYATALKSSMKLLERLGIADKVHCMSAQLSGGMKRRLQLACALSGGASVLVLDEPTSGLDVETRRELWDLLLSMRGERTVLLTTHFMEEADALGDRVAALHMGQLRCHATNMYLKKAIGTGYRLSLTTNGVPRDAPITSVVTSLVPDAFLKEKTINSLSYNLPATGSSNFPRMFTQLEGKKRELGIESIGVGVSTLEEVFLKLCSDMDTTFNDDEDDTVRIEPTYNKVIGLPLYWRQFCVLFRRQIKYVTSNKTSYLMLQVFIPVLMIVMFTLATNNTHHNVISDSNELTMNLDIYGPLQERKVLYNIDVKYSNKAWMDNEDPELSFDSVTNIRDTILRAAVQDRMKYYKYLVGIEMNDKTAKALYTTVYRHAAPVAVNLLSNMIASQYITPSDGHIITTHNYPIEYNGGRHIAPVKAKAEANCFLWSMFIGLVMLTSNIIFASLVCRERDSGSRHIQIMAGCPVTLHWLTTLTFHSLAALVLVVVTVVAGAVLDTDRTLTQSDMILTLMLVMILGRVASFALMYVISFYLTERATGVTLSAQMLLFGLVTPLAKVIILMLDSKNIAMKIVLNVSSWLMPQHTMVVAISKCVYVASMNAGIKEQCLDPKEQHRNKGCAGQKYDYFAFNGFGLGEEILLLSGQIIVYMTLVVLIQKGLIERLSDVIFNKSTANASSVPNNDEIVRTEADFVSKEIVLPSKQIGDDVAMLVHDIHKSYHRVIGKSCYAVQGLSFSIKKGECFGLLGVNGAGKSTTFKMLTAEICPTKGDIYANGNYIKGDKDQYLRSLGYCPQFFGLDDFQSGRDNLTLLLTLRGLDAADVTAEVKQWISVVGLEKYSDRVVSSYSGGCTRRLAAAAALSSGAPLTLLDEPTAGVDVAARRKVWTALRRSLKMQRSTVITSHSMDEMEALCSRIGIMSGGRLRALGTPAELRARHAQGHAVVIKVKYAPGADEVDSTASSELNNLKTSLKTKFDCTLKDEHKTMLHYHINETLRYSALFAELESLRTSFPSLVEDYAVTETTLEEVFLSFAKESRGSTTQTNGIV